MNRLSALGVSAHEKELFADDNQTPEEYANITKAKQIDNDSDTFESMEKIKNMLVVSLRLIIFKPTCTLTSLKLYRVFIHAKFCLAKPRLQYSVQVSCIVVYRFLTAESKLIFLH